MVGGEHTATLAALNVVRPDTYVHIDAHFDLRDQWPPGQRLSHATFARRAHEKLGFYAIYIGVRAYDDEEYKYAEEADFYVLQGSDFTRGDVADAVSTASGRVYLSLDIDVLDPSEAPGVGTPEAGGLTYRKLEYLLADLILTLRPVAVDVMEYSPPNDVSDVTAVKVVRLIMHIAAVLR
jgi:agmatinase